MTRRTSALGYYVRGAGEELNGLASMDTGAAVDTINNLDHLQDEATQYGGNHVFPSAGATGYWTRTPTAANAFELLDLLPGLPVPLHVQSDGSSSRIVVALRAYVSGGTGSFRVSLAKLRLGAQAGGSMRETPIATATTTGAVSTSSTTPVTLTTTVYVDRVSDDWLVPPALSGSLDAYGRLSTVRAFMGQIEIWSAMSSAAQSVRLTGISFREYVG